MPGHDIVVVGASAGGVEALSGLARALPAGLPASVFVVLHIPAESQSVLPAILSRVGRLPAGHPRDGERIEHGRIYVAPPGQHLLLNRDTVRLARGPRENGHRPAVDPLFRTAARSYGPRVVGVVLSGALDDGTAGLSLIKRCGGVSIVQEPSEALFDGMPSSALQTVEIDYCRPIAEIAVLIGRLARTPAAEREEVVSGDDLLESDIAELDSDALQRRERPGTPSGFTCPECHGALWEFEETGQLRFRCRVGHALTADSLLSEQTDSLEAALWVALRALEEKAALAGRLAERAGRRGHELVVGRFAEQEREARDRSELIRRVLLSGKAATISPPATNPLKLDTTG